MKRDEVIYVVESEDFYGELSDTELEEFFQERLSDNYDVDEVLEEIDEFFNSDDYESGDDLVYDGIVVQK